MHLKTVTFRRKPPSRHDGVTFYSLILEFLTHEGIAAGSNPRRFPMVTWPNLRVTGEEWAG